MAPWPASTRADNPDSDRLWGKWPLVLTILRFASDTRALNNSGQTTVFENRNRNRVSTVGEHIAAVQLQFLDYGTGKFSHRASIQSEHHRAQLLQQIALAHMGQGLPPAYLALLPMTALG